MIIKSVWTENEGDNVVRALSKRYGAKRPGILLKYAVRDFIELTRLAEAESRFKCRAK